MNPYSTSLILTFGLSGVILAGDVASGPQVGDKLPEFKVLAFSGPDAGKETALPAKGGKEPTLLIFVHKITRPGLKFLRPIDEAAAKENKLSGQIVWLGEDKEKSLEFLKRAQNSLNLQVPIGVSLDGKDGPATYGLNDRAAITVVLARDAKVVANFALVDPNDTDSPKVLKALGNLLGK